MKKALLLTALALTALLMASCDTKSCKCYVYDGVSTPYMETDYVSEGTPCSSLSYNRGTQYRECLEYNEPDIDPNEIGQEYKK